MFATRVNRLLISALVAVFFLVGCKKHSSNSTTIPQSLTNWTWESGAQASGSFGYYDPAVKGTPTTTAQPSARSAAMSWVDSSGQFWVFSGIGGVNDMWKFNTTTLQWAWISGNAIPSSAVAGNYPTSTGMTGASYIPGQRNSGATWVDSSGTLWMFGGYGTDANGLIGYMNDLWTFSPSTTWWTWVGGSNQAGSLAGAPDWGTMGVAASTNQPNPRSSSATWADKSGNLYMFGGNGYLNGTAAMQNDLWVYNTGTKNWTWLNGSQTPKAAGNYGAVSVAAPTNHPGARQSAATWSLNGIFYMFGGAGVDANGALGNLNDLWKYDPSTNLWTWVNGSNVINAIGNYGTTNVSAATNQPGARYGSTGWVDNSGNIWLFGGNGINSTGSPVYLNDLWKFQFSTNQWVWYNGSYNGNYPGYYGTLGVLSSSNGPGSRYYASNWKDSSGNFWMYGGEGLDATSTTGHLGDVWKFLP